jgi:hypothetical protein
MEERAAGSEIGDVVDKSSLKRTSTHGRRKRSVDQKAMKNSHEVAGSTATDMFKET